MFVNAPKYELLRKDKFLVILVTLNHKDYNNWINVECEIKGKNRISIDYLDVGREECTDKVIKDPQGKLNDFLTEPKHTFYYSREPTIELFPYFIGDVALCQVYKKEKAVKEKKQNWLKKKLGLGKQTKIPMVNEEMMQEAKFQNTLKLDKHPNYASFLNSNLLEVCRKSSEKLFELYPMNANDYKEYSYSDLTQLYIFTPSIHTIMTMGGLDLLWPLTNYLFLFKGAQIENLHREVFQ